MACLGRVLPKAWRRLLEPEGSLFPRLKLHEWELRGVMFKLRWHTTVGPCTESFLASSLLEDGVSRVASKGLNCVPPRPAPSARPSGRSMLLAVLCCRCAGPLREVSHGLRSSCWQRGIAAPCRAKQTTKNAMFGFARIGHQGWGVWLGYVESPSKLGG